jgi:hypothetical protein
VNFADLKRNSSNIENLTKAVAQATAKKTFEKDERYWTPTVDKDNNGSATIRLIPDQNGDYFVRKVSFSFQGPSGKYFIEPSPSCAMVPQTNEAGERELVPVTVPCPADEYANLLWAKSREAGEKKGDGTWGKLAKKMGRKLQYVANIVVLKDKANPENEGKVFLYNLPITIYNKIEAKANPDEGRTPVNVFSMFEGANLYLKIKDKGGYRNYDDSEFDVPGPVADEATMEKLWKQTHPVAVEVAAESFKSYDELKKRLVASLGHQPSIAGLLGQEIGEEPAKVEAQEAPAKEPMPWEEQKVATSTPAAASELDFFKKLAAGQ